MKFISSHRFGGHGSATDQFPGAISGLAAAKGVLFAAGGRQVKSFSPAGELIDRFEVSGAVWSIAATDDSLWVGMRGRVEQLDLAGKRRAVIDGPDRLGVITGVAVGQDRLLVADAQRRELLLYKDERFERRVGGEQNTRGFMIPNGVLSVAYDAVRPSFVVAHPQKHRVERYALDGAPLGKFGRFGHDDPAAFGGCCNPTTCAVTPDGVVLASEKAPPWVKAFTADGQFLAATPSDAFDPGAKNQCLAADVSGCVYATDSVRGGIVVLQLTDD